jgi:hypothetical protein
MTQIFSDKHACLILSLHTLCIQSFCTAKPLLQAPFYRNYGFLAQADTKILVQSRKPLSLVLPSLGEKSYVIERDLPFASQG